MKIAASILLAISILLSVFAALPAAAQTDYIFDQESFVYSGTVTFITRTGHYNTNARIYTGTANYYAQYEIDAIPSNTIYDLYAYILPGEIVGGGNEAGYGAMRYTVDDQYLDTLAFYTSPEGWNLVGTIVVGPPDRDIQTLTIDRADTSSGDLVIDAIKFAPVASTTAAVTTTIIYNLPTTGDAVLYHRETTAGDIMIAAPVWGLLILLISVEIWRVARGRG